MTEARLLPLSQHLREREEDALEYERFMRERHGGPCGARFCSTEYWRGYAAAVARLRTELVPAWGDASLYACRIGSVELEEFEKEFRK